jgi:hypothetical protein
MMLRVVVALVGAAITFCSNAIAQQSPSAQTVNALYERYQTQLPTLTPAKIEKIWSEQSQSRPWFQGTYGVLNAGKDDPQFIDTLRKEIPCSETNAQTRDATFSPTAYQFQCLATQERW